MTLEPEPLLCQAQEEIADRDWAESGTSQSARPRDLKGFGVRVIREGEGARLMLRGELDMATAPQLEDHLRTIERDRVMTILIDLALLTFMDSSGLKAFLGASRRAEEKGRRLAFTNCPGAVRRVFEMTGTGYLLDEVPFAEM
jgi:anti-sigma B factor antagonist